MGGRTEYTEGIKASGYRKGVLSCKGNPWISFEIVQIGRKWCNLKQFKPLETLKSRHLLKILTAL